MPIYEYACRDCDNEFELIVNASTQPACPECRSTDLEKQFSVFAAGSGEPSGGAGMPTCGTCGMEGGPCALN